MAAGSIAFPAAIEAAAKQAEPAPGEGRTKDSRTASRESFVRIAIELVHDQWHRRPCRCSGRAGTPPPVEAHRVGFAGKPISLHAQHADSGATGAHGDRAPLQQKTLTILCILLFLFYG
jgi:hypothetical protein